jgi:alpha-beta hydrolase superfamily lysophospholipase
VKAGARRELPSEPQHWRTRGAEAIFVHGLGTSQLDLLPVARAFEEVGVHSVLLVLDGHGLPAYDLAPTSIDRWLEQIRQAVDEAVARQHKVYLVGFSVGASLALRVAWERKVDGVLCLSAFVRPKKRFRVKLALRLRTFPPIGARKLRVSRKRTRRELRWADKLPTPILASVIAEAPRLSRVPRHRRVLFVHSVDDPVASYSAVAECVQQADSTDVRLVSLSGLAHFIQFDIAPSTLCRLALTHFLPSTDGPDTSHPTWIENVKQREDEVKHWSRVLSLLFFAFFTLSSALLNATLGDVISRKPEAPYLLFTYALLVAVYLQFVFLYFFYLNRTQAYLRIYCDPLQEGGIGWVFYRTTPWVSGRASVRLTRLVSLSGAFLPLILALAALVYAVGTYHGRLLTVESDSVLLQLLALLTVCWLVLTAYVGTKLVRHTRVHLYLMPPVVPASREFLHALEGLYASIRPGRVEQMRA